MWDDIAFGNYVAGQAEADSCFCIGVRISKTSKFGVRVIPLWEMQKVHDELILQKIRDFIGISGRIYHCKYKVHHGKMTTRLMIEGSKCERVVAFFETFSLRGEKKKDFDLWKKAVKIYVSRNRQHFWTKEDLIAMLNIRKEMDQLNRRHLNPGKMPKALEILNQHC
jgi:hypothetical protein